MFIDTHCHLDFPEFDSDREEVVRRSQENGIGYIINIGSSLEGSRKSIALAQKYSLIYATVGIHPHEADNTAAGIDSILADLAKSDKVVAIGEIGLDYYLPAGRQDKNYSQPKNQKPLFVSLVGVAKKVNLPFVIHNRQAEKDTLAVLKDNLPLKAVVHCFSGDENFLKECLDLGLFISFTCNVTYKKAEALRRLVKITPLERLMLETDAPFLPPEGFRGRRNEPLYVKNLAEEIARIKGIGIEEVAATTSRNAKSFFHLK